jgi:hypothetical protein
MGKRQMFSGEVVHSNLSEKAGGVYFKEGHFVPVKGKGSRDLPSSTLSAAPMT